MAKKAIESKPTPTPGKKACPECGELVGVRTGTCACGHEFERKAKTPTKAKTGVADDFKSRLLEERDKLEELLANRDKLEERLKAINDLLDTM